MLPFKCSDLSPSFLKSLKISELKALNLALIQTIKSLRLTNRSANNAYILAYGTDRYNDILSENLILERAKFVNSLEGIKQNISKILSKYP